MVDEKKTSQTYFIEAYNTPVPTTEDEWKVALPPEVARKLILEYSNKGDVVYDPFAGYGTIVGVAKEEEREAFGTEIEQTPIDFARKHYGVDLLKEDAFSMKLETYAEIDLCIFSPPYWGPALQANTYEQYLQKLAELVKKIKARMKKNAHLIILIQNYQTEQGLLTLAWDVGKAVQTQLQLKQDIIWCVDRRQQSRDAEHEAADHHYCLVFENKK